MNLEEAKATTHLSKDEINSIKKYLGVAHLDINILADFSPQTYLNIKDAWVLKKEPDRIAEYIQDFINVYAAMYKESRKGNITQELIRGTSNKRMQAISENAPQFLSTSTDQTIAKTFTEYGDDALAYISVGKQVPFLNTKSYKNENSLDEKEIILAPFCQTYVKKAGMYEGYTYYQMNVEKPILEEKTSEELVNLYDEIISRFALNVQEIEELDRLQAKSESLNRAYQREHENLEEQEYILGEQKKVEAEYARLKQRTYDFREKLQSLLKGLCRQKEKEIDQAYEMVVEDKKQRRAKTAERRKKELASEEEETKAKLISELTTKLAQTPQNAVNLESAILDIYDSFVHNEEREKRILQRFEIEPNRGLGNTSIRQLIEEIRTSLGEIQDKTSDITIDDKIDLEQTYRELIPLLDGVSYGVELTKDFPKLEELNQQQTDKAIKKSVYDKVQSVLQNARIQRYREQRKEIQEEKVSFWGKLFGKEQLREAQLKNLDLKIQLEQRAEVQEKEYYSIREMLVDMHICADKVF